MISSAKLLRSATITAAVAALVSVGPLARLETSATADAASTPAGVSPVQQRGPDNVTADALPTVQIDGVVWSAATVGNTVYAGGSFATARPAGAAAGTNTTARSNLLAFDITTGNLITSFAPSLNAQAKVVVASPDGSRIYVGGSFTKANGANRYRIAAYSTTTGQLLSSFAPALDATVNSISATNSVVYVGGAFSTANGVARAHLAAFNASNGALLGWAPTTDDLVQAVQVTPDGSRVIIGGQFKSVNGTDAYGLGAVNAVTGTRYPWTAENYVRDAGSTASILSLSTDGTYIYGTGYVFGSGGNYEGVFAVAPNSGNIHWLADCHGDTYDTYSVNGAVYVASHLHFCANIGGFPDTYPRNWWYRGDALSVDTTGTVQTNTELGGGYGDFTGQPSPSLINWIPEFDIGTYTGQEQGPWTMAGNSQYVVSGGEFLHVNGTAQQGLVRFAIPSIAPNKQGPRVSAAAAAPSVRATSTTSVAVGWQTNWDRDDQNLGYTVYRDGSPIYTTSAVSQRWNQPIIGFTDTGRTPGTTYGYRIRARDDSGNTAWSDTVNVTMPTTGPPGYSQYAKDVINQGAIDYWRLDHGSAATSSLDYAGYSPLSVGSGVTAGANGAIVGDPDKAATFNGTSTGIAAPSWAIPAPKKFTISAWFSTTSRNGGKILGFGSAASGTSSKVDRHIYLDTSGRVNFGVDFNGHNVIRSAQSYNDGQYHQVVASFGPTAGMRLYVDGALIASKPSATAAGPYVGYWRIGGDSSWSGGSYFSGRIDDVSVYPKVLTMTQIHQQYLDSGRAGVGLTAPADSYGQAIWNDSPLLYYRFDETGGSTATDVSGNEIDGRYSGSYTLGTGSLVTDDGPGGAVTFRGTNGTVGSAWSMEGPTVYSEELWFKTTSTAGGKLIGFGSSQTGTSSSYDRHVYMLGDGRLVFGTFTGTYNTATTTRSYNDGQWHYLAATQGPDGMTLYVDGTAAATNPTTSAQSYDGYWRIGGDNLNTWSADGAYFNGVIDEPAVYLDELTADQVRSHFLASALSAGRSPTAAFSPSMVDNVVTVNAAASSDPDGTIASYAWDFGDGSTGTGVTATHTYAAAGVYQIQLTLTDNTGLTDATTATITAVMPNQPPTASFTADRTALSVAFDGSASSDTDGTIGSYAWDFGDGRTGTGVSPTHTYAAPGTYSVTLTVTDDKGATGRISSDVTVDVNKPPAPVFAATAKYLTATFDATASTDPDGTISSYAWEFGDGTTSTDLNPTHTYPIPRTYSVTLTVTDNLGATASTTRAISVPTELTASDAFSRTTGSGSWGSADLGGGWTLSNGVSQLSVSGGVGRANLASAGASPSALLNGVSLTDVDAYVDSSVNAITTGGGATVSMLARHAGSTDYRLKLRYMPGGVAHLALSRVVNGSETVIREVAINLTYQPGDVFRLRFQVTGTGTTSLSGTIWQVGSTPPANPQITATDSTASLQGAGGCGLVSSLSGSATNAPILTTYDNLIIAGN
ncbi:MAG TPA: PKD domain-containing protein [Jatrophihabitans sp.]|nr:PKD domain-containing protein [Jatrophihabitans sp.]